MTDVDLGDCRLTILGLGFVPGTYTYTWGFGPNEDSLTVTSVPEPGTWTFAAQASCGLRPSARTHKTSQSVAASIPAGLR